MRLQLIIPLMVLGAVTLSAQDVTWQRPKEPATRGRFTSIAVLPNGTLIIGEEGVGPLVSHDDGRTWSLLDVPGVPAPATSIAHNGRGVVVAGGGERFIVSFDTGRTWNAGDVFGHYAAVDDARFDRAGRFWLASEGVLRSDERARAWWLRRPGEWAESFAWYRSWTVGVLPLSSGAVLAATSSALFRSTDLGSSWDSVAPGTVVSPHVLEQFDDGAIYRAMGRRLVRSTDDGVAWSAVADLPDEPRQVFAMPDGGMLALGRSGAVYSSRDTGATWGRARLILDDPPAVRIGGTPARLVLGTVGGAYESRDSGRTWQSILRALPREEVRAITALSPAHVWLGTASGAVLRIVPIPNLAVGQGFAHSSSGLPGAPITALCAIDSQTIVAGTGAGLYRAVDGGMTWSELTGFPRAEIVAALATSIPGHLLAGGASGQIRLSTDSGRTWRGVVSCADAVTDFAVASGRSVYAACGTEGLRRSSDGGVTWSAPAVAPFQAKILSVEALADGRVVVGTRDRGVFETRDDGATWRKRGPGLSIPTVPALAVDRMGNLFAATHAGGVFRLDEGRDLWIPQVDAFTARDVFALVVVPGGSLLAGTDRGLFSSIQVIGASAPVESGE